MLRTWTPQISLWPPAPEPYLCWLLSTLRLRWTSPQSFLKTYQGWRQTIWNCRRASSSPGWTWTSWKEHMKSEDDNCFSLLSPVAIPYPHPSSYSHVQNKRACQETRFVCRALTMKWYQIDKHRITSFYLLCWCSFLYFSLLPLMARNTKIKG